MQVQIQSPESIQVETPDQNRQYQGEARKVYWVGPKECKSTHQCTGQPFTLANNHYSREEVGYMNRLLYEYPSSDEEADPYQARSAYAAEKFLVNRTPVGDLDTRKKKKKKGSGRSVNSVMKPRPDGMTSSDSDIHPYM